LGLEFFAAYIAFGGGVLVTGGVGEGRGAGVGAIILGFFEGIE